MCENDEDADDGFAFIEPDCQRCDARMDPYALDSGMVVLRCPGCGLVAI